MDDKVGIQLTPLAQPPDWTPGKYAAFPVSPEPMYGPDELGEYKGAIDQLEDACTHSETAAGIWEAMQAWEARLFSRGYQFLNAGRKGWGMLGAVNGAMASGQEILQTQNMGRMFAVNVYAARQDKSSSILAMDVPGLTFIPSSDADPVDQTAADEKKKYLKVWLNDAGIKDVVRKIADLFYTDDRAVVLTWSEADEQRWGTDQPRKQLTFGAPEQDGIAPETEMQPAAPESDVPAVREVTYVFGKLESKVPMLPDEMCDMPWVRVMRDIDANTLRERYPWIEDKIKPSPAAEGDGAIRRYGRMNVRLAVQTTGSSSNSLQQDGTEQFTFYRPSQYRAIKDKDFRKLCYQTFPDGMLVVRASDELAYVQNRSMNDHIVILHAKEGSGQNRRAIGSNYLPLQKILNANISLLDRYFRACVPRRFHDSEKINSEAINAQLNDPAKSTPVLRVAGESIADYTGIENTPQPSGGMFEFIQWLIQGAPEVMDGMEPSVFGGQTGAADQGVYQTAKLKRDAARGIYSGPWSQICNGLAKAAEQAADSAALNRVADIGANIPGQGKINVELSKMQGNALCHPDSTEIPQSISEQEEQMAELIESGQNVAFYQAIVQDPRNLTVFSNFPSLSSVEIPGVDDVEDQQGEFEILMQSGPIPNPQIAQIQEQVAQGANDPEAQTPEGQQAMQQAQQALQQLPPLVSTVPVAQNATEDHVIHAAITLGMMKSPEGRKLKNGNEEQKAIYQNLELHWQEHVSMSQKLTPPKDMEFKGTVSVDPSKFAPDAQAKIFEAMGLNVAPQELQNNELIPHEVTTEKEGVDEQGVPVKQKIAMINPAGKLH